MHMLASILLQTSLPSKLPHNIEQSSLCYTVGLVALFIHLHLLSPHINFIMIVVLYFYFIFIYFLILEYGSYCCNDYKKLLGGQNLCIIAYVL